MHHDARIRQRVTLTGSTGSEEELPHRGSEPHADGGHVATNELHGVVNRHAGRDRSAGAVDVEPDVGIGVLAFQIQQLSADLIGDVVVHVGAEHDDSIFQQPGEDVGTTTTVSGLEGMYSRREGGLRRSHDVKAISRCADSVRQNGPVSTPTSLHGLIVADAYGIPNARVNISNKLIGGDFKFKDYCLSVGREIDLGYQLTDETELKDIEDLHFNREINFNQELLLNCSPWELKSKFK